MGDSGSGDHPLNQSGNTTTVSEQSESDSRGERETTTSSNAEDSDTTAAKIYQRGKVGYNDAIEILKNPNISLISLGGHRIPKEHEQVILKRLSIQS